MKFHRQKLGTANNHKPEEQESINFADFYTILCDKRDTIFVELYCIYISNKITTCHSPYSVNVNQNQKAPKF